MLRTNYLRQVLAATLAPYQSATHCRWYSSDAKPLHFCVVGTGPAGFYTVDRLLKKYGESVRVDLVDRLPSPFGLVRSGVAPDHQDTKNVINQFTAVGKDPRCSFFGHVRLGQDVQLQELRQMYHGVVLAYGAESDRKLNIPGEEGRGVLSAREFVWWYNGHPDARQLPVDLSKVTAVAVCGIGNVALDCARVLLQPPKELEATDIAEHAMQQLRSTSRVQCVHLVARRGPVQAACTPKELKELVGEASVRTHAPEPQMAVSKEDEAEMKATRMKRRIVDIIKQAASSPPPAAAHKHLHYQFYRNPVEILLDASGAVEGLKVEKTQLKSESGKPAVAVGTGEYEVIPVQLVLKSIGYRSLPVEGAPFDSRSGTIPNSAGKVLTAPGSKDYEPGLYVCGWLKRGPSGIIGTNLVDADETVETITRDGAAAGGLPEPGVAQPGSAGLQALLAARGVRYVGFDQWLRLDSHEVQQGQAVGKVRQKVVDTEEMLRVCGSGK